MAKQGFLWQIATTLKHYTVSFAHLVCTTLAFLGLFTCANQSKHATAPLVRSQTESERANILFDDMFTVQLKRHPMSMTRFGMKQDYDKWDDLSEAAEQEAHELNQQQLRTLLSSIEYSKLDAPTKLSYDLMKQSLREAIADFPWRYHNYPVNQMHGLHAESVSMLIGQHLVHSVSDAQAYISRLNAMPVLFEQLGKGLMIRADKGIIPPKFVFPHVIRDSRNIVTGAPFDQGPASPIFADISAKISRLDIPEDEKAQLTSSAENALTASVGPAYAHLIAVLETLHAKSDNRDGAWKFPNGDAFYHNALARTTTTKLSAQEIHALGLREVTRIHTEMQEIRKAVGFTGDLQEFFAFMREDKQFYYEDTSAGQQRYITEANSIIDAMRQKLDEVFITKPKAPMVVRRVEAFREKSAGRAFYEPPSVDGTRPGMYFANLSAMANMPTYQMEALAFHEGIPGHHMQIAIAQELQSMPKFRKYGRYTAYIEGWGLYSEFLPKEMGFYKDPYSDFGRLAMELWRACRLVVDTGIHYKQWSREKAIEYLDQNTPNPHGDVVKAIERYIVMPSQATAYKIGMLKIIELREHAKSQLGDTFDIREFHEVVLANGPLPLTTLEQMVNDWIAAK